ncbi:hypothetical protein [uncultured Ruminococcus sp.]|uniref:rolling circle replication-associated protein n=1 Tax=uncultured Ruminococcus sp. TaxID=165186 RepID=UPI0025940951|nr:hypothetical protein [uncultured Ruminococcus sp.]
MPTLRNAGVESEPEILPEDVIDASGDIVESTDTGTVLKLPKNIYRARSTIYELAYCNSWDWFFTGTIDGGKLDRTDLGGYRKKLTQMIRDYNKRKGTSIKYLIVPELHSDRENWHVHGFLQGLPVEHLHRFQLGDQMSAYIAKKVRKGQEVYSWKKYQDTFGWCDLEPIASHDGACKYVTKYISKALDKSVSDAGKHMFYASLGLHRRSRAYLGDCKPAMLDYLQNHPKAFKGDYTVCLWLDSLQDVQQYL